MGPPQRGLWSGSVGFRAMPIRALVQSLRPKQWVKNGFVAAPLVFADDLFDGPQFARAVTAVVAFCLASSATYLLNDVLDREADRLHPRKRNRPVAAGTVSVRAALAASAVLATGAIALSTLLGWQFILSVIAYLAITLTYTLWMKHAVILDVMGIAAGFVVRVIAGCVAISVEPSPWILICTGLLAMLLGFGKRRHEVITLDDGDRAAHRRVLADYSLPFLDVMLAAMATLTIAAYAVYTATGVTTTWRVVTLPVVAYGVLRYLWLLLQRNQGGSPTEIAWTDRPIQASVIAWVILSIAILGAA
jgi:4-hydroxybenzoate polyprenyltransferase